MNTPRGASGVAAGSIAWTISRRLGMVIVLALAFLLSAVVTIYILFRSGDTQVPNLLGKSEVEAQRLAGQAGLRTRIQRREDTAAPGTVIETRPGPNSSVKKDSNLTIVVSNGPPQKKGELSDGVPSSPVRWFRARRLAVVAVESLADVVSNATQ
ncbi:MAG TPA: PASTA domain-containing protein [Blastocatellia bacterium]|nr:PASTA domain-containing protein [Blastocatellia bacterium]